MSEVKWIKITTDMFEDEKIDFIASLPEADTIIVVWIRILALAGKCNAGGYVFLTEKIPYTDEMLAHKFKKPLNVIKLALETFKRLDMLDLDNDILFLPNWEKHQNVEAMEKIREYEKNRKAVQRQKKKLLELTVPPESPGNVPDGPGNVTVLDIELDLELEREKIKTSSGSSMIGNNPFSIYEKQGFGKIDETSAIFVGESIDTYGEDWVRRAMIEAVKQGKKTWSYVENGILKRWKATGHAEPWTLEREEPKQQQRSGGYGKPSRPRMEVVKDDGPEVTPEEMEEMMKLARKLQGA